MLNRKSYVFGLLIQAKEIQTELLVLYEQDLENNEVSLALHIKTFLFFCCLRTILDFLAHDILDFYKIKIPTKEHSKIYFPLCFDTEKFKESLFYKNKSNLDPDVFNFLENYQPFNQKVGFSTHEWDWVVRFNTLVNENKHRIFSEKKTQDNKGVTIMGKDKLKEIIVNGTLTIQTKAGKTEFVESGQIISYDTVGSIRGSENINNYFSKAEWCSINFVTSGEQVNSFIIYSFKKIEGVLAFFDTKIYK